MKRFVFSIIIVFLSIVSYAQTNLDGTWFCSDSQSETVDKEQGQGDLKAVMYQTYRFKGNAFEAESQAKITMDISAESTDGEKADVVFRIDVTGSNSGTLEFKDGILTLTPDKKKPKVTVDADVEGIPGGGLLKSMVANPLKKELTNELKKVEKYKVLSLTATELTLQEILTEKEIKKGDKAETLVFTRK